MLFNKNLSAIHAYLCADGYVIKNPETQKHKYYYIGLRNTDMTLLRDFQTKFYKEFRIKPIICKDGRCKAQNKELYYFLTKDFSYYSYEWDLPRLNNENVKSWLRAFFDCEAWVIEKSQNRLIGLDSVNEKGIHKIKRSLERFNINSKLAKRNKKQIFRLLIHGKENLTRFQREINFLHPKKKERLNKAVISYRDYHWRFPKGKNKLISFISEMLKEKLDNKRVRVSSIKKENLATLQYHLKQIFRVSSKVYDCKRYYELNIQKKADIKKLKDLL